MTNRSVVSVVIPCFNASRWISATLESAFSQQHSALEVVAVDDGSTDDTARVIERRFPSVKLIRTPNRGASHARNTGTRAASGKWIQYLDADDLLAPGKFAMQLRALEQSGADVAYGDWQRLVQDKEDFVPGDVVSRRMQLPPDLELFEDFWCPPAAYLFRRKIVDAVGRWNEGLPVIQDARFALDCALYGGSFTYTPGVVAYYRVHRSGSVSTRNPVGFVRDCLKNATEIEQWWTEHGGLTSERVRALVKVYSYVARASFDADRPSFEAAYAALKRLKPGYRPEHPTRLALASRVFGYRRAESLALGYRRAKRLLQA